MEDIRKRLAEQIAEAVAEFRDNIIESLWEMVAKSIQQIKEQILPPLLQRPACSLSVTDP